MALRILPVAYCKMNPDRLRKGDVSFRLSRESEGEQSRIVIRIGGALS